MCPCSMQHAEECEVARGIDGRLSRIERRLDALLDALAGDGEDAQEQGETITTMDGQVLDLPRGNGFL